MQQTLFAAGSGDLKRLELAVQRMNSPGCGIAEMIEQDSCVVQFGKTKLKRLDLPGKRPAQT